jgi:mannose-6-phosphate isomerase-like protein (cupin superfamily)
MSAATTEELGPVIARTTADYDTFRIKPTDTNYMAMIADPIRDKVPFTAFVEVFEPGGATPLHHHSMAHEMFFVIKGEGASVCEGERIPMKAGDSFLVRPGHDHIVENTGTEKLYCLTVMVPNEGFAELVRTGMPMKLSGDDLAAITGG